MIAQSYITEWSEVAPWSVNVQVEQDLIICRALCSIYEDEFLASHLAFRGGTALGKLYLHPQHHGWFKVQEIAGQARNEGSNTNFTD